MKETIPHCLHDKLKFLVVLREPVDRALSSFNMMFEKMSSGTKKKGIVREDFNTRNADAGRKFVTWTLRELRNAESRRSRIRSDEDSRLYKGMYADQLRVLWSFFSRHQTLVMNYDTLTENRTDTLTRIASFLEIDAGPLINTLDVKSNAHNSSKKMTMEQVDPDACYRLEKFFHVHNQELDELLQRDGAPPQQPQWVSFKSSCSAAESRRGGSNLRAQQQNNEGDGNAASRLPPTLFFLFFLLLLLLLTGGRGGCGGTGDCAVPEIQVLRLKSF